MRSKIITLTLFSIAMGLLETAVVVYLRIIYFPKNNEHPTLTPTMLILITELGREFATIIMLVAAGMLSGKTGAQKFSFFMFSFAVWDLSYYVFLKLLLNWPSSVLDWDLLFLLPVPWIGPVLAPCLASVAMIAISLLILRIEHKEYAVRLGTAFWSLLGTGFLVIILSFVNYRMPLVNAYLWGESSNTIIMNLKQLMFQSYNWPLFSAGLLLILGSAIPLCHPKKNRPVNIYS